MRKSSFAKLLSKLWENIQNVVTFDGLHFIQNYLMSSKNEKFHVLENILSPHHFHSLSLSFSFILFWQYIHCDRLVTQQCEPQLQTRSERKRKKNYEDFFEFNQIEWNMTLCTLCIWK